MRGVHEMTSQHQLIERARNDYDSDFMRFWKTYPRRGKTLGANDNKTAAARCWLARERQGYSAEQMIQGAENYAAYCRAGKIAGTTFVMQARTFLGPDCHFLCEWEAPEEPLKKPRTNDEWLSYGKSIGIEPRIGEPWPDFKARCKA